MFLYDTGLECPLSWPHHEEGSTRSELRAALADFRQLEGFLSMVGSEHEYSDLTAEDESLSRFAESQAVEVGRVADRIEATLATLAG